MSDNTSNKGKAECPACNDQVDPRSIIDGKCEDCWRQSDSAPWVESDWIDPSYNESSENV